MKRKKTSFYAELTQANKKQDCIALHCSCQIFSNEIQSLTSPLPEVLPPQTTKKEHGVGGGGRVSITLFHLKCILFVAMFYFWFSWVWGLHISFPEYNFHCFYKHRYVRGILISCKDPTHYIQRSPGIATMVCVSLNWEREAEREWVSKREREWERERSKGKNISISQGPPVVSNTPPPPSKIHKGDQHSLLNGSQWHHRPCWREGQ